MSATAVTCDEILNALRETGVKLGDTLMAHSSLKSFGQVENGADTIIDALLQAVGPEGHVVMPTLTASFAIGGKQDSGIPFNPETTPSRVGFITNCFRNRPEAVRSKHPTHSLACIGPKAKEWMDGHDQVSTFSWDGPYGKYVCADGKPSKIAFMGVRMVCNTTLHAIEDWLLLPYMSKGVALVEQDGEVLKKKVTMSPLGCRGFYSRKDRFHALMEETGQVHNTMVGEAEIKILDARFCVAETIRQELAHPGILLCLRPDCEFCTEGRAQIEPIQNEIRARAELIHARGLCSELV